MTRFASVDDCDERPLASWIKQAVTMLDDKP